MNFYFKKLRYKVLLSIFIWNVLFILYSIHHLNSRSQIENFNLQLSRISVDETNTMGFKVYHKEESFLISIFSSIECVNITIGEYQIYYSNIKYQTRGINVIILHDLTVQLAEHRVFDTYSDSEECEDLIVFLESLNKGSIIFIFSQDDAWLNLNSMFKKLLTGYGSTLINNLEFRGNWIFVFRKDFQVFTEHLKNREKNEKWPTGIKINFTIDKIKVENRIQCLTKFVARRKVFCQKHLAYPEYCKCDHPYSINSTHYPLPHKLQNKIKLTPVIIICGDRPQYLIKVLDSLTKVQGIDFKQVIIDTDSTSNEIFDIAALFNIKLIKRKPICSNNCKIALHYKHALFDAFDNHTKAKEIIILEDDVVISPDFLWYISQTIDLLHFDESLFCISAWNDQGYLHSTGHRSMLYRVQTMPGLGWVLKRSLFEKDIFPIWPQGEAYFDWDMWMRQDRIMQNRDCIIPDLSRSFHIGKKGINMNPGFQKAYFSKKASSWFKSTTFYSEYLISERYENLILKLINVNNYKADNICNISYKTNTKLYYNELSEEELIKKTTNICIQMNHQRDYKSWIKLCSCWNIWNLDARGFHNGMYRIWFGDYHFLIIGYPYSKYSKMIKDKHIKIFNVTNIN